MNVTSSQRNLKALTPKFQFVDICLIYHTTLQSKRNAKVSKQRFWHCYENRLIKTIQMIPHNLEVSVKLTSLYCGLSLILVYPNPQ